MLQNGAALISVVRKQIMVHCGNGKTTVSPSHGMAMPLPAASPSTSPSDDLLQQPPHVN
ncbi:hypothetical protein TSUD_373230 [Trifolium subterraneum]|uniref:Uncharacterized protein n=1 Tax=Trifolium subterraneum TaxID=3900 RepID=A0A2Z6NI52_TRISU|nr:hypothetical protein TSUD_373230 [Trifolium subterraneum]